MTNALPRVELTQELGELAMVEDGWRFSTADFSVQANGQYDRPGSVTLVRAPDEKAKWHAMPDELKDDPDGPPLYALGRGMTLEEAITAANLVAAHSEKIPA